MNEKPAKPASAFSKYAKGLLSRPTTAASQENRSTEAQHNKLSLRDLNYTADNPISAIALSPDSQQVVLAGRDLLRVLSLQPNAIVEKYNLRQVSRANINYSSNDVKWGTGATANLVATAASNGTVVVFDLEHEMSQRVDRVINAHSRAVNRLDFNPGNGSWLLSASQDGSMKLWDLRDRDGGSRFVLHGKAEAVRDVQFNSTNALELAAVYDNGTLQKWDLRNSKIYERKLNAHNGPALTLNWHADGKHLVTGGRDKVIKIWDMRSDVRKPARFLATMAPVARVSWRPGGSVTNCQIASCAFSMDNSINIWSLNRPSVATRTFESHSAAPTGILWKGQDTLLSCSKDCTFRQQQVLLASAPIDSITHYAFGWSNMDDIAIGLGSRRSDKQRMKAREKTCASDSPFPIDLSQETRKSGKRNASPKREQSHAALNTKIPVFKPNQAFGIITSDEEDFKLLVHLAERYVSSGDNAIRACTINALVSFQAQQMEKSKAWKLIKLELEHIKRGLRNYRRPRQPSIQDSLNLSSKLGESLIRRDLERLRLTPRLTESGNTTMRGSPSNSFIMPRYADGMPPLSLPVPRSDRQAHGFIASEERSRSSRTSPVIDQARPSETNEMILPRPTTSVDEGMEHAFAAPASVTSESSAAPPDSQQSTHSPDDEDDESDVPSTRHQKAVSGHLAAAEDLSPRLGAMSPIDNRELSKGLSLGLPKDILVRQETGINRALERLVLRILHHYTELGDVQMCATLCLVLGEYVSLPQKQVDEWLYCYIELLQRQRLFVTATEVINHSKSELIRSLADKDIVMHTTCNRCKKAVPLLRDAGDFWMCPRCQNTVGCIVCGTIVKGSTSWCRSCAHSAHPSCRAALMRELEGMCPVPDCGCQCIEPDCR